MMKADWLFRIVLACLVTLSASLRAEDDSARNIIREDHQPASNDATPRTWVILSGVQAYQSLAQLRYTQSDVVLLHEVLQEAGVPKEQILVVCDVESISDYSPTKSNLETQIGAWLAKARPQDAVLLYFSGHGFMDSNHNAFLAPIECELNRAKETAVPVSLIREQITKCAASKKMIILDCCRNQATKSADSKLLAGNEDLLAAFSQADGLLTLASCREGQYSYEWDEKGHGLFTWFLVEGIRGEANRDGNDLVDADELYKYVHEQVSQTAGVEGWKQEPHRFHNGAGVFVISRLKPESDPDAPMMSFQGPINADVDGPASVAQGADPPHTRWWLVWPAAILGTAVVVAGLLVIANSRRKQKRVVVGVGRQRVAAYRPPAND